MAREIGDQRTAPLVRAGAIDLHLLFRVARSELITLITITAVFLAAAILYLHVAKQKYAVRTVITSTPSNSQTAGGTLDELSSISGIDLPSGGNSQFKLFVGALRSPFAAQAIGADEDLVKVIFPKEWSAAEGRWREPPSHVLPIARAVAKGFGWHIVPWSPPGVGRISDYLERELKIVTDSKSGTVTLEIDSDDPRAAERVLIALNNAVDERMRQRDLERSTTHISYLESRLSTVTVEEYRRALVSNLFEQERTRMLASAPLAYVSDMLGKPMISAKPVSPVPVAVLAAGLIIGGLLGLIVARVRYNRR